MIWVVLKDLLGTNSVNETKEALPKDVGLEILVEIFIRTKQPCEQIPP